jgi:hypothetical protein
MRQRYMRLSVQRPGDNPKDLDTYIPYPVPSSNQENTKNVMGKSYLNMAKSASQLNMDNFTLDPSKMPGKHDSVCQIGFIFFIL